jgi:anti-sigma regulatory factor (Ser/Thr protein kinase)
MTAQLDLSMRNSTQDVIRVMGEASTFMESLSVPSGILYKANLVLEEILTNIVKYAYSDRGEYDVSVHLCQKGKELIMRFVDTGCEFNPLTCPPPAQVDSLLDCPVGGLGIYLVCKTVDRIEYRREQNSNILTVGLNLTAASG